MLGNKSEDKLLQPLYKCTRSILDKLIDITSTATALLVVVVALITIVLLLLPLSILQTLKQDKIDLTNIRRKDVHTARNGRKKDPRFHS